MLTGMPHVGNWIAVQLLSGVCTIRQCWRWLKIVWLKRTQSVMRWCYMLGVYSGTLQVCLSVCVSVTLVHISWCVTWPLASSPRVMRIQNSLDMSDRHSDAVLECYWSVKAQIPLRRLCKFGGHKSRKSVAQIMSPTFMICVCDKVRRLSSTFPVLH